MSESKPVEVELLPSVDSILRAGADEATLNRLVQQKVAEIMAERDAAVFEPFFRSRQIAYEIKRLQTMPERRKFSVRFERLGCMICKTRERIHVGCGMCTQCYNREFRILQQITMEGMSGETAQPSRRARALLEDEPARRQALPPSKGTGSKVHRRWNKPRARRPK